MRDAKIVGTGFVVAAVVAAAIATAFSPPPGVFAAARDVDSGARKANKAECEGLGGTVVGSGVQYTEGGGRYGYVDCEWSDGDECRYYDNGERLCVTSKPASSARPGRVAVGALTTAAAVR
jgi:hypothetical protein